MEAEKHRRFEWNTVPLLRVHVHRRSEDSFQFSLSEPFLDGWSVAKAKRMGASAAKLLVYYNPAASNAAAQERFVERVATECRSADLPLFVEPLSFEEHALTDAGADFLERGDWSAEP